MTLKNAIKGIAAFIALALIAFAGSGSINYGAVAKEGFYVFAGIVTIGAVAWVVYRFIRARFGLKKTDAHENQ